MNSDTFLKLLQSLITVIDLDDPASFACGKAIIVNLSGLLRSSGKADHYVIRMVIVAERSFRYLVSHKAEFAGRPGEIKENSAKRHRLEMYLTPHC